MRPRPPGACLARAATAVIRVDHSEGLIRLTAAESAADPSPLLMDTGASPPCSAARRARGMTDPQRPSPNER